MKKYLVLGGNGFLGKYIVRELAKNNKVLVADYNINHDEENNNVSYVQMDFVHSSSFANYLQDIDSVIHLICTTGPNEKTENINKEIQENVFPTITLLENMVNCNVPEITFISSGGTVYGEHSNIPIKENENTKPICNYGIIKDLIEKYLYLYNLYYGINYKIIRLANPYSDITKEGKKQGIIPILVDQIDNNLPITIWGDGQDIRDYIYIDDAINGIMKVLEYTGTEHTFNIGTGQGKTVNEILEIIKSKMKISSLNINYVDSRKCDVKNNILDCSKIETITGWEPMTSIDDGIEKVIGMKRQK